MNRLIGIDAHFQNIIFIFFLASHLVRKVASFTINLLEQWMCRSITLYCLNLPPSSPGAKQEKNEDNVLKWASIPKEILAYSCGKLKSNQRKCSQNFTAKLEANSGKLRNKASAFRELPILRMSIAFEKLMIANL